MGARRQRPRRPRCTAPVIAVCAPRRRLRPRAAREGEDRSRIRTMAILWRSLLLLAVVPLRQEEDTSMGGLRGW
jgi:hypothetical protein